MRVPGGGRRRLAPVWSGPYLGTAPSTPADVTSPHPPRRPVATATMDETVATPVGAMRRSDHRPEWAAGQNPAGAVSAWCAVLMGPCSRVPDGRPQSPKTPRVCRQSRSRTFRTAASSRPGSLSRRSYRARTTGLETVSTRLRSIGVPETTTSHGVASMVAARSATWAAP